MAVVVKEELWELGRCSHTEHHLSILVGFQTHAPLTYFLFITRALLGFLPTFRVNLFICKNFSTNCRL